ncbi:MAG: hypothetical protein WCE90_01290 [Candidatus Zixiibacteriota bacterium]
MRAAREQQRARDYAASIVETVREPLIILNGELKVISANRSFYQTFNVSLEKTEGYHLYQLGQGQWNIPKLRELLNKILTRDLSFSDFKVEHSFPSIGRRKMLLNARRIVDPERKATQMIMLAIKDITGRKKDASVEAHQA